MPLIYTGKFENQMQVDAMRYRVWSDLFILTVLILIGWFPCQRFTWKKSALPGMYSIQIQYSTGGPNQQGFTMSLLLQLDRILDMKKD